MTLSIAERLRPMVSAILGDTPEVPIVMWDGSRIGPPDAVAHITVTRPDALRRIIYAPGELGFARAYVMGDVEFEGDMFEALRVLALASPNLSLGPRVWADSARAMVSLGVAGKPLPPPPEEAAVHGRLHSVGRDRDAIAHHYDLSNEFYELFLGPSMTYSCARFVTPSSTLEEAQEAKHDLVARKLGLRPGMRFLDVGCGWGGMVIHAASRYGVDAVGITISREQHEYAIKRVADAGLANQVEIRLQDYRELPPSSRFDAISSIGMAEHVGRQQLGPYFACLAPLLAAQGRLLNHAISTPNGASLGPRHFITRYVFPDGELPDVAEVVVGMQKQGLDVRDVEGLRDHYGMTLRKWADNLVANWDEAVRLVGLRRARVWKLYLISSAVSFEVADIGVHQVLGVRLTPSGAAGMPLTRETFV